MIDVGVLARPDPYAVARGPDHVLGGGGQDRRRGVAGGALEEVDRRGARRGVVPRRERADGEPELGDQRRDIALVQVGRACQSGDLGLDRCAGGRGERQRLGLARGQPRIGRVVAIDASLACRALLRYVGQLVGEQLRPRRRLGCILPAPNTTCDPEANASARSASAPRAAAGPSWTQTELRSTPSWGSNRWRVASGSGAPPVSAPATSCARSGAASWLADDANPGTGEIRSVSVCLPATAEDGLEHGRGDLDALVRVECARPRQHHIEVRDRGQSELDHARTLRRSAPPGAAAARYRVQRK